MVSMPHDAAPGQLWTAEAIHSRPVVMRRAAVLSALARRLVALRPRRRLRVAIDGVDGAGKSVLADELATRLMAAGRPAVRASVDSFHRPQADRYRLGRTSPEGFYRDSYNYQRLTEFLLVPFAPGGSGQFRVAGFDYKTDTPVSPPKQHAARRAVLILDGIFLHAPSFGRAGTSRSFCTSGSTFPLPAAPSGMVRTPARTRPATGATWQDNASTFSRPGPGSTQV
jgi:hypothetical protein